MSKVESTPEMASKMYAAMEARLAIVRKRMEEGRRKKRRGQGRGTEGQTCQGIRFQGGRSTGCVRRGKVGRCREGCV